MENELTISPAQTAWEHARGRLRPVNAANYCVDANVLRTLRREDGGLPATVVFNPRCPADILTHIATEESGIISLAAAWHRSCPGDVAIAAFQQWFSDRHVPMTLMHTPPEVHQIVLERTWNQNAFSQMANLVSVANHGTLQHRASEQAAAWLTDRTPATAAALGACDETTPPLLRACGQFSSVRHHRGLTV